MRTALAWLGIAASAALLGGCLYANVSSPYSYRSASPIDIKSAVPTDPAVTGKGCNYSVLWLVAWGKGGYIAATADALKDHPQGVLYDVKTDIKVQSVLLGLWSKQCTIVTGRLGQL